MLWMSQALDHQILPHGDWWSTWLLLAGRGSGKTRAASEQTAWWAWQYPATRWLVAAPTSSDIRGTCFEGDSGLLSVIPPGLVADYNKALHELRLTNKSLIKGIPASEPERFRGPQFHGGWCCIPGTLISMADGTEKPIETLKAGETVLTRHGQRRVLASGISGNPSGLVTITSGSTRLTVTEDHPILVGDQWIPAGKLKEGDLLWTASFTPVSVGTSQRFVSASSDQASIWPRNRSSDTAASDVMQNLRCAPIELKQMAVRSVERLPNSLTYNLTVEGEHEFIANGVVVHNCDELAAWEYIQEAWDQIQFGMRLKLEQQKTRLIITTTPKPRDLIIDLINRNGKDVALVTATTYSNLQNLSENFKQQILSYEGTKLGRQEIYAEIIDPEEGGIIKRDWFKLWPAEKPIPKLEYVVQSYDCAYTQKTHNDPTASITIGVFKPEDRPMCAIIIDCWQDRLQYPDLRRRVADEFETVFGEGKDAKRVDLILVEDKASGIVLIQDLQRAHLPVRAYNPGKADKIQRLSIVANVIKAGRVYIPESTARAGMVRDWAEEMLTQICSFPDTTHDDYCDALSQCLRYLRDAGWLGIDPRPQHELDEEDYIDAEQERVNPYAV